MLCGWARRRRKLVRGFVIVFLIRFYVISYVLRRRGRRGDAVGFCFSFNKAMYEGEESLQRVGEYLETMRRPVWMPDGEFKRFKGVPGEVSGERWGVVSAREDGNATEEGLGECEG